MNASNNFTVVGFICKDAEVRNFEKSSIARFGVSIKTTEKKGGVEITSSSIQNFETWIKSKRLRVYTLPFIVKVLTFAP